MSRNLYRSREPFSCYSFHSVELIPSYGLYPIHINSISRLFVILYWKTIFNSSPSLVFMEISTQNNEEPICLDVRSNIWI